MSMTDIYILGGAQTDFARNWAREGKSLYDMFAEALTGAVENSGVDPEQIQSGHVGNFVGELFAGQGLIFRPRVSGNGLHSHGATRSRLRFRFHGHTVCHE
jgi:acetyl-CoA acetyltransferase